MLSTTIAWYVTFASYDLHNHCNMHISQDHRQSPLKALLNTLGTHHKNHIVTARYGDQDAEDVPAPQDSAALDLVPPGHIMPRQDHDSSGKYSEETDTCHTLAESLEQFQQLKDQFSSLKSATHPPTPMAELTQLTDKLQHPTMMLQLHPTPQPNEEPMHKTMQAYTDILHATQRGKPHHDAAVGYSHIQWTGLLKARGLVHGHRNCR